MMVLSSAVRIALHLESMHLSGVLHKSKTRHHVAVGILAYTLFSLLAASSVAGATNPFFAMDTIARGGPDAMPRLMFITISGADTGDTKAAGWNRLIQPLGSGSYDVASFMRKVWAAGYNGPVGFQGFGITQEPRAVVAKTMEFWREMTGRR